MWKMILNVPWITIKKHKFSEGKCWGYSFVFVSVIWKGVQGLLFNISNSISDFVILISAVYLLNLLPNMPNMNILKSIIQGPGLE